MVSIGSMEEGILTELGNIGAGRVGTALSRMTGATVDISSPEVFVIEKDRFKEMIKPLSFRVYAMDYKFEGLGGGVLVIFPRDVSEHLMILVRGQSNEMLNLLMYPYSKAIRDYVNMDVNIKLSKIYIQAENQVLSDAILPAYGKYNEMLLVDTRFSINNKSNTGHMTLYLGVETLERILEGIREYLSSMI